MADNYLNSAMTQVQNNNDLYNQYFNSANAFSSAEAEKDRQWQEYMSNTSYQRAVKDLQSAGLNPILATNIGGASTPSGAMAHSVSGNVDTSLVASMLPSLVNSATTLEASKINQQTQLESAKINAASAQSVAQTNKEASKYASDTSYRSSVYGSNKSKEAQDYRTAMDYLSSIYNTDVSSETSKENVTKQTETSKENAQTTKQALIVNGLISALGGLANTALNIGMSSIGAGTGKIGF